MRFVKFLAFFLLLAGDVSSKPASLEANTPVVGCDGRVNILLAPEVFSQTVKHSVAAALWWQFLACCQCYWLKYVFAPSQSI